MRGYGQFCPIAVASEVVAERWTLLLLRELLSGARRFGDFRHGVPLMSRTLLAQRLRTLEEAGLLVSTPRRGGRGREYQPTAAAEEFRPVLDQLGTWGQRWATSQFDMENLDVGLLMWNMRRRVDPAKLPEHRVVTRFEFRAFPSRCRPLRRCWPLLERSGSEVCVKDPMLDVDVHVEADAAALARVWLGAQSFAEAVRSGGLRLHGSRDLVRAFPTWFLLSRFAGVERVPPR